MSLRKIAANAIRHRADRYWYKDGAIDAVVSAGKAAGKAAQKEGKDIEAAVIDAMAKEMKRNEFIYDNDPCDKWTV